jgi:hypothetical protein
LAHFFEGIEPIEKQMEKRDHESSAEHLESQLAWFREAREPESV